MTCIRSARIVSRLLCAGLAILAALFSPRLVLAEERTPEEIFEQRIMPIFRSPAPSSCVECHLSGVELKDYILPSHEKTFLSLRDAGLIDLESPADSKILRLIRMADDAPPGRIAEETRRTELAAFAAWIEASCRDEKLRTAPPLPEEERSGPDRPVEVIRHNRADRVLDSFVRNVWSLRFRCHHCHMDSGPHFARLREKHGDKMEWMKEGPAATMRHLIERELIDVENPEDSLLLLKPLNEVEHGGGLKMARNDADYIAFLSWIEDYARVVGDEYETAAALPATDRFVGSEIWLRVEGLPDAWLERTGLLTVHAWDRETKAWRSEPAAVTSFNVRKNPKFGVFAMGFLLLATPGGDKPDGLAEGEYRVRLLLDSRRRATTDLDKALADAEPAGESLLRSTWAPGFPKATVTTLKVRGVAGERR